MSEFSNKELLALSAAGLCNLKTDSIDFTANYLILVTAAGTIYGKLVDHKTSSDFIESPEYIAAKMIRDGAHKNKEYRETSILLHDVVLVSASSNITRCKFLYVFPEDIIAISIGECSFD